MTDASHRLSRKARKNPAEAKIQPDTVTLAVLGVPAAIGIGVYAAAEGSFSIFALSMLIGASTFALGALLGFLFGVPQYFAGGADAPPGNAIANPPGKSRATYQPNTNLTQVSDWLTKIIIGVGLVEFGELTDTIGRLGDSLEPSLGGGSAGKAYGISLVVGFFVIGFLVGYLFTRLRLQWAFATADRGAFEDAVAGVVSDMTEKKIEQQGEADARALQLKAQQLDPTADQVPPERLKEVFAKASAAIVQQVRTEVEGMRTPQQPLSDRAKALLKAIDQASPKQP